jgi:isopentenyl phosphate kinase
MTQLTFIKFGGSAITNKHGQENADITIIRQLASELQQARLAHPDHHYLVGHGSGSFGHYYAAKYHIHTGLQDDDDWMGYALTSGAASRLNRLVIDALLDAGIPAITVQPSAALQTANGIISHWDTTTISHALAHGLVPVVHGDVAFDTVQGSSIVSTEMLMSYLALHTEHKPTKMIMVGESAVYTGDPHVEPDAQIIPLITRANIDTILKEQAGGSHAVDVTGGMQSKVHTLWQLVEAIPGLEIHIIGVGVDTHLLYHTLMDNNQSEGTRIRNQ